MTAITVLRVVVDGASYDEPEVFHVEDGPAVRLALADWEAACERYGDGRVEVTEDPDTFGAMAAGEFLEAAANSIGADANEIDELLHRWQGRAP
jgi:hypothetical protein